MKVLQINCVYGKGSTGKITADLHKALLEQGVESVVCYGRGDKVNEPHVYKTCGELYSKLNNLWSRVTGVMYGGCFFSTNRLIGIIKKEKPDVVHLQCINGYFVNIYRLITWLKKSGIKTVLTLHAEFMFTANCGHAFDCGKYKTGCGHCPRVKAETRTWFVDGTARSYRKMQKAFDGFDDHLGVTSVSPWLMERAKGSPSLGDTHHHVVMNGLDTDVFYPRSESALREEYGLTDKKILFHATPTFTDDPAHIKGGYYVLKLAEMLKNEPVQIVVAGEPKTGMSVPANVTLLGRVADQNRLAEWYSVADATVIASRRETFSMICAESLCCGTPMVGFKAGGPESISLPQYSSFVNYGDVEGLCAAVRSTLAQPKDSSAVAAAARAAYDKRRMAETTLRVYHELMKGNDYEEAFGR